jgi:radical SAM superfamily enzyme YgiQ (UPF0313 family)
MKNMPIQDMKILLVNPPSGRPILQYSHYPLGLGYIAQSLREEGYQNIQIRDYNAHAFEKAELTELLARERFHVVGVTGLVTAYHEIKILSDIIKETSPETCVILGGGLGTAFPEIVVKKTGVDVVVLGEGENAIKELVSTVSSEGDLNSVHGICFLDADKNVRKTPARGLITDLDGIAFPNRELFSFEVFLRSSPTKTFHKKSRIATMYTSRGCPYSCGYCFSDIWGRRFRHRSPENIVEEIKLLEKKYQVTGIHFVDDVFTIKKEHTMSLCEEILRQGIKIDWLCSTRVNLVDTELLRTMKRAGCKTICYGLESANPSVLVEMNKKVTVEQAAEAVEKTWRAGIIPYGFFMIGYFGETEESIRDTVNFCIRHGLPGSFSFPTPIPGTDLFRRARNAGIIQHSEEWILDNWKEWQKDLNINVTDIPNERLKELRFDAEKEILRKLLMPNLVRYFKVLKPVGFFNYCYLRLVESR